MSALSRITVTETRLFLREPIVVFFAVAFAPILLVILGSVTSMREPLAELDGRRLIDVYLPIIVAMGIALFALSAAGRHRRSLAAAGAPRRTPGLDRCVRWAGHAILPLGVIG